MGMMTQIKDNAVDMTGIENGAVPQPVKTTPIQGARMPTVDEAWNAVMNQVQHVAKTRTASTGGASFQFRGIDDVVDAVGPALRDHGVTVLPKKIKRVERTEYETKARENRPPTRMWNQQVTVVWQVRGPAGDSFEGESVGEASDAGDKSMSKAQSVAYRVFLLQALCIPTGERDPDYEVHERAADPSPEERAAVENANEYRGDLLAATKQFGWTADTLVEEYRKRHDGADLLSITDVTMIRAFSDALVAEAQDGKSPVAQQWPAAQARADLEAQIVTEAQKADAAIAADRPTNQSQLKLLHTLFGVNKMPDRAEYLKWCSDALGRPVETTKDLTGAQISKLIDKQRQLEKQQPAPTERTEPPSDDNTVG